MSPKSINHNQLLILNVNISPNLDTDYITMSVDFFRQDKFIILWKLKLTKLFITDGRYRDLISFDVPFLQ